MRLTNTTTTRTITAAIKKILTSKSSPVKKGDFKMGDFLSMDFKTEG